MRLEAGRATEAAVSAVRQFGIATSALFAPTRPDMPQRVDMGPAEHAGAVRADLQAKQSRLQEQIGAVKAQYEGLTPEQQAALAAPGPAPTASADPAAGTRRAVCPW